MARFTNTHQHGTAWLGRLVVTPLLVAALIVLLVVGAVGVAVGAAALRSARAAEDDVVQLSLPERAPESRIDTLGVDTIEVPDLVGLGESEARTLLSVAGLSVQTVEAAASDAGSTRVAVQAPEAGTLVDAGSTVTLTLEAGGSDGLSLAKGGKSRRFVVCVDPGHQEHSDSSPEALGPGSKRTKPRVSGGSTGVATTVPECEVALQLAMNLKGRLEAHGVRVVMTRTTNDVNLSNAERAAKANKTKADLFLRIHGAGNPDETVSGIMTVYPAVNGWTKPIAGPSRRAAKRIHRALVAETGAVDGGVGSRKELAGFNWSKVPAVMVECGYLSNRVEDRLLVSPYYQDKVSEGIAAGVMEYLYSEEK